VAKSNIAKRRAAAKLDSDSEYVARRNELIVIAAQLFREKGFAATRPQDIAERAGIDRASLYYYIGGKEELFRESLGDIVAADIGAAKRIAADTSLPPSERLGLVMAGLMRGYATSFPQMFVYIQEQMHLIDKDDSEWGRKLQKVTRDYEQIVMALLREGKANGEFDADLDPMLAMYALFGMLNWTHRWFRPDGRLSHDQVANTFKKILLNGICQKPETG